MPGIRIEPSGTHPLPFDLEEETVSSAFEDMMVTADTAELLAAIGAPMDPTTTPEDLKHEQLLIKRAVKEGKITPLRESLPAALGAAAFLRTYGQTLALDVAQVRSALTNKLLELADCGDPKHELRAIELLGKHVDIGLFSERSEITVNYNTPEALERAIKDRVKRLLSVDVVDLKPMGADLDVELGLVDEGEFEEVTSDE